MDKIKWEFEETRNDWTIRGHYDEPNNIELLYKGKHFAYKTFPGYKIWNIPAHLGDFIEMSERERLATHTKLPQSGSKGDTNDRQ